MTLLSLLAVENVTWIKVERPVFDLVGVVLSSLGLAGICAGCWREWEGMEVKVINEYRLSFLDPQHREMIQRACLDFLGLAEHKHQT